SNSAIMTVDSSNYAHGVSVGSVTITGIYSFAPVYTGQVCNTTCPTSNVSPQANGNVTPAILLGGSNGTDITNTTQSVVVGQQIVLYGKYQLPSGFTFTSQSWTIPGTSSNPPTAIHNFTTGSIGGPVPLTSSDLSQQSIAYYWVAPNSSAAVTFTLNYVDNQSHNQTASATATFNVVGPTSVQIQLAAGGQTQYLNNGTTNVTVEFGDPTGTPGIQLSGSANSPPQVAGTYEWAQIIATNSYSYTVGSTTTSCNGPTGLDNSFPLPIQSGTFTDSPDRPLPSGDNKFGWNWSVTTYFIWNPGLTGSIRVPLGQRTWQFFSDSAQNMSTHIWTVQSDSSSSIGAAQIGYFPIQWNSVALNGSLGGCQ
ncbi:MAG TPA: hypothetical protein VGR55_08955, partial [Candidatus Acidoferrum sp.]|nr:hypothetical protein [Candidatus Acidoferrum sp.]